MKTALISPNEQCQCIVGWRDSITPIFEIIPDAARVVQVESTSFPVAPPLFWIDCDDTVTSSQYYYDTVENKLKEYPPAPPRPVGENQPAVSGAQTI